MIRTLMVVILTVFSITLKAQGYWKLESNTDDYTMEKEYIICHYSKGLIDAVYFVNDKNLKVIRTYEGLTYFDTCWNAKIYNDGKNFYNDTHSVSYYLFILIVVIIIAIIARISNPEFFPF